MEEDGNHNDVLININEMLVGENSLLASCIYKVPHEIRKLKEDAYTPKIVSIGPFHHGDDKFLRMEELKRIYHRQFITERSETKDSESFVSCVQELEAKIRDCYSDDTKLSEEDLATVILTDCCFILEFSLKLFFMITRADFWFLPRKLVNLIYNDLFLLENQVPFFVLEKLYNLAFPSALSSGNHDSLPSLVSLILPILPEIYIVPGDNVEQYLSSVGGVAHFTDLYRKLLLRPSQLLQSPGYRRQTEVTHLYSASELNELGVKFKVNKNSKCSLDLELSHHTLRIPFIVLNNFTEIVWRNLLAFEQCHFIEDSYFLDYIVALDFLINTDKDVDLLIKEGIIENWLGDSNAVTKMFNNLGAQVIKPDFNMRYANIFQELNAFSRRPCNQRIATLRRDYCSTPWTTVASIAGIFLLILTVIQTIFSILQVVH
ncbi:hypothetical protein PIB30_082913 [Stylosanthes scabra]|uniref:Uncharacterized protein n=1 Tax=Stylosanthes scabra TaxID=79078 RepID=A0ABU6TTF3_9FABA|nr:hypothetical protein [Stylosanthes scabra]